MVSSVYETAHQRIHQSSFRGGQHQYLTRPFPPPYTGTPRIEGQPGLDRVHPQEVRVCAVTLLIIVHDTLLLTHLEAQGLIVQAFIVGPGHYFNVQTVCSTCEWHILQCPQIELEL